MFVVQIHHADGLVPDRAAVRRRPDGLQVGLGRMAYWRVMSPSGVIYDARYR